MIGLTRWPIYFKQICYMTLCTVCIVIACCTKVIRHEKPVEYLFAPSSIDRAQFPPEKYKEKPPEQFKNIYILIDDKDGGVSFVPILEEYPDGRLLSITEDELKKRFGPVSRTIDVIPPYEVVEGTALRCNCSWESLYYAPVPHLSWICNVDPEKLILYDCQEIIIHSHEAVSCYNSCGACGVRRCVATHLDGKTHPTTRPLPLEEYCMTTIYTPCNPENVCPQRQTDGKCY